MDTRTEGRHLLAEYRGCDAQLLNDRDLIEDLMQRAVLAAGAHIVQSVFHQFSPQGVSGVVVVEESHISIHTWPEVGYAAVDFYTCGAADPTRAHAVLVKGLRAIDGELILVHRGDMQGRMRVNRAGWSEEAWTISAPPSRQTVLPDPTHYFMASGAAEGPTPLNAFDHALLDAGVGDTNLVRLSSILPPGVQPMQPRALPGGAMVPIAYAEMTSSTPGEVISAAVALALPADDGLPGLIMEHHAAAPLAEVEALVRQMAIAGMEHRGRAIKDVLVRGATHTVEEHGSAFAAVVLWRDD